ncbi:hypothetical protein J7M00_00990 [bacterium]|nr:hypothetical protein [bacterium]
MRQSRKTDEIEHILEVWAGEVKRVFGVRRNGYYKRGLIYEYGDLGQTKVPRFRRFVGVDNLNFSKKADMDMVFLTGLFGFL